MDENAMGQDSPAPKLVVGIGASAGGLDACRRFLASTPSDSGMAFVIIMHLDPGHESHLVELFGKATGMDVVQVSHRMAIVPNRVYIIAPDTSLEIRDRVLKPSKPKDPRGHRKPVDALFSSLAGDQRERAAAVVLSGTGNNGSSGIRDIKAHGGLCLVQEPETAEYDGMPRNAIETGEAHYVLPPEEMPGVLAEYSEHPGSLPRRADDVPGGGEAFDDILNVLGRTYGVNFRASYKRGTLERRAARRMALKQTSSWTDYLDVLQRDPQEVAALYRDLLIGVTSFFRDPEVWEHLESAVLPDLLGAHDPGLPIKIWAAGCATGEEAYSLAIAVLEQLERLDLKTRLQVFASDVAEDALAFARRGVYPASIQESVSPERLRRFFRREGEGYEISREVRDSITFAVHNLLADPPFSHLDMVSCRNVLIYLEPHAQQRILEIFHFALKPHGMLLLGASETIGQHGDLFEVVSKKARVYRSTSATDTARHHRLRLSAEHTPFRCAAGPRTFAPRVPKISRVIEQIVLSRYTTACVVVNESFEIQSFFGPTRDYLTQPTGEARMDLLTWVKPGLYSLLRAGLEKARITNETVRVADMRLERGEASQRVESTIEPIWPIAGEPPMFLVSFRDVPAAAPAGIESAAGSVQPLVRRLEAELKGAREELQSTLEQLESTDEEYRASQEEFLSLNEELQSNNEELESSKEELQSLSEEMLTINKQLEDKNAELHTAFADLNNLVVSTRIPILFLNRNLHVRRFTPAFTELMNLTPSDVGRPIEHIKERFHNGSLAAEAGQVMETLAPAHGEVLTEDGRWYSYTIVPYRTVDDRIEGVCIAFNDINDRKKAFLEMDEARRYAEAIVQTVPTPLLILNGNLRVQSANEEFYRTFRVAAQETEGLLVYELGNRQWDIPRLRELLERILPDERSVKDFEVEHEFEQIGRRVMRLNGVRMSRSDRQDLILLAVEDVTEQRKASRINEERAGELMRESARKNEFLAVLGHELRNPFAALMHGLDLLESGPSDPARGAQILGMMRRQAKRVSNMLDQLLDITRLTSGKIRMSRVPVSLAEATRAAVEAVAPLIKARGHALVVSLPEEGIFVRGDFGRLTQVVENLLSNAARYTAHGGKITVSLAADGKWARLRVRDNGIGLQPEILPHIFDLFTHAPRMLEHSAGGLGLGLPLVKNLVEMHGGHVEASSPGLGQGTEFVVTLPRFGPPRGREKAVAATAEARALRILVVDDEKDSAEALAEILALKGHDSRAVHDGAAALKVAREFMPDVVLLDLGLPGMDGYEVARRLRETHKNGRPLLVALTGYQEDPERLSEAGFDRHLLKPPEMPKLYRWLEEIKKPE